MNQSKRSLLALVPAAGLLLLAGKAASEQSSRVDEKDAIAVALSYKHNATQVDAKAFKQFVSGSNCASCALYLGKSTDAWASCGAMGGKQVSSKGWCIAYAKKP